MEQIVVPTIPFKDNKEFIIPSEWVVSWIDDYGPAFVLKELNKCRRWCLDNPDKQKYAGVHNGKKSRPRSFLGGWLARAADRRGLKKAPESQAKKYARKYGAKA